MNARSANVRKPRALTNDSVVMPFAPASPAETSRIAAGVAELARLGWKVAERAPTASEGYFAATTGSRRDELVGGLERDDVAAAVIPALSQIERMSVERAPVAAFAPHSRAAQAYQALWAEVRARTL